MVDNFDALMRVVAVETRQDELSKRIDRFEVTVSAGMDRVEGIVSEMARDVRALTVAQGASQAVDAAEERWTFERLIRTFLPHITLSGGAGFLGWIMGGRH